MLAKFRLNNKLIDIHLVKRLDIEGSVMYSNPDGKAVIYYSPLEQTLYADCQNPPKNRKMLGIEWEEIKDVDEG